MKNRGTYQMIARYSAIIFVLPACLLIGYFIGYKLDGWLGTSPLMTVIFLMLGVAAGFLQVFRILGEKR